MAILDRSAKCPMWAKRVIKDVLENEGRINNGGILYIEWRKGRQRHGYARGYCRYPNHIYISAGKTASLKERKWLLLHELAHYIIGGGHGHDRVFYDKEVRLLRRYNLIRHGISRDGRNLRAAVKRARKEA